MKCQWDYTALKVMWNNVTHFSDIDSSCGTMFVIRHHTANAALADKFVNFEFGTGNSRLTDRSWNQLLLDVMGGSSPSLEHSHIYVSLPCGLIKVLFVQFWSDVISSLWAGTVHQWFNTAVKQHRRKKVREAMHCLGMQQCWCSGRAVNAVVS